MKRIARRIFYRMVAVLALATFLGYWLVRTLPVEPLILFGIPAMLLVMYGTILWGLLPHRRMLETVTSFLQNIPARQFAQRLYHDPSHELAPLVQSLNRMLDQVEMHLNLEEDYRQRFIGLLENMASGVMLLDARGKILLVNPMAAQLLGRSREALIGQQHLAASHHYELGELIERCRSSGGRLRRELTVYYPQERVLDVHLSPISNRGGGVGGVVVVMHDITEIRRMEQLRKEFVANVSHELRTPLTAVKGFAETLLDGAMEDPETLRNFLEIIWRESDRMHRMIGDLLDLTKIESGQVKLDFKQISVRSHAQEVLRLVRQQADERQLTLELHAPFDFVVEADPDRFRQILLNLLTNAVAYTPTGGRVDLVLEKGDGGVWIRVRDTGIGIPKNELPYVFERLYRVNKDRSRESGGTGLGLAIVKQLVDSHHGQIHVESELGRGSQFSVFLPARQPAKTTSGSMSETRGDRIEKTDLA